MAEQVVIDGMESLVAKTPTPMHLIEVAISKGADANQLAVLMDLQLRWEANEAKKNYESAFEVFKRNLPDIFKTKRVSFPTNQGGKTEYSHAELDKITPIITEALLSVGIVHQWRTSDSNNRTTVTCLLRGFGHTEEAATLAGPSDTSGGKNNVQAIGSTVTYLQRYTLLAACGIAAKGTDDDGKTEGLPESTITDYCIQMQDASSMEDLKKSFKEAWDKAKSANDTEAMNRFNKVKETRKRDLL